MEDLTAIEEIDGRIRALMRQRDAAMNEIVVLSGKLAVLERKCAALTAPPAPPAPLAPRASGRAKKQRVAETLGGEKTG